MIPKSYKSASSTKKSLFPGIVPLVMNPTGMYFLRPEDTCGTARNAPSAGALTSSNSHGAQALFCVPERGEANLSLRISSNRSLISLGSLDSSAPDSPANHKQYLLMPLINSDPIENGLMYCSRAGYEVSKRCTSASSRVKNPQSPAPPARDIFGTEQRGCLRFSTKTSGAFER